MWRSARLSTTVARRSTRLLRSRARGAAFRSRPESRTSVPRQSPRPHRSWRPRRVTRRRLELEQSHRTRRLTRTPTRTYSASALGPSRPYRSTPTMLSVTKRNSSNGVLSWNSSGSSPTNGNSYAGSKTGRKPKRGASILAIFSKLLSLKRKLKCLSRPAKSRSRSAFAAERRFARSQRRLSLVLSATRSSTSASAHAPTVRRRRNGVLPRRLARAVSRTSTLRGRSVTAATTSGRTPGTFTPPMKCSDRPEDLQG